MDNRHRAPDSLVSDEDAQIIAWAMAQMIPPYTEFYNPTLGAHDALRAPDLEHQA